MLNLPFDLITNILTRLPVKSLVQFKCVSKPWCSLIKDPNFIKMHLKHAVENNNVSIMLRDCFLYSIDYNTSFDNAVEINYPYKTASGGVEILASCNGLLCLSVLMTGDDVICIWNPCTQEYKKVPDTPIEFPNPDGFSICRTILYGLGYDHSVDDYKLVRVVHFYGKGDDDFDSEVKVYTLGANTWRRVQDVPYHILYKRVNGVLVNGAFHWVATRKPESDLLKVIISFDVVDEMFKEVPQPDYDKSDFHMNVGVLGGCLCVLSNFHKVAFDLWVMKDYGVKDSWTKLLSISQQTVLGSFDYLKPLCYYKKAGIVLEKDGKDLVLYDPKTRKGATLKIRGIPDRIESEAYVGSLVSLNSGTYLRRQQAPRRQTQKNKSGLRRGFLALGLGP